MGTVMHVRGEMAKLNDLGMSTWRVDVARSAHFGIFGQSLPKPRKLALSLPPPSRAILRMSERTS